MSRPWRTSAQETPSGYVPADAEYSAGGDWFDVFGLSGGRLALVVGDVVGHGIAAAAAMGRLRTAVRTLADLDLPPALTRLDRTSVHLVEADEASDAECCSIDATCVYAVYDPAARTCAVALAGHPPPAVTGPDGALTFPDLPPGTPLGYGLPPCEAAVLDLPPGGLIALCSDGLVEDRHHDVGAGMERVRGALARPAATPPWRSCARRSSARFRRRRRTTSRRCSRGRGERCGGRRGAGRLFRPRRPCPSHAGAPPRPPLLERRRGYT
ncbi:PP2C family protein-serine/threonine phosphatase [Streptomyces griseoincarnatus]